MRKLILMAACILAGCQREPAVSTSTDVVAAELAGPPMSMGLQGSPDALRQPLQALAGLKDDGLPFDRGPDGFTDGESITAAYGNGTLAFYTMPDGGLWKVRLTSGFGDSCGRAFSAPKQIEQFVQVVTPSADAGAIAQQLVGAIRDKQINQVTIGSVRYGASGGCLQSLTITELAALPPEKRTD